MVDLIHAAPHSAICHTRNAFTASWMPFLVDLAWLNQCTAWDSKKSDFWLYAIVVQSMRWGTLFEPSSFISPTKADSLVLSRLRFCVISSESTSIIQRTVKALLNRYFISLLLCNDYFMNWRSLAHIWKRRKTVFMFKFAASLRIHEHHSTHCIGTVQYIMLWIHATLFQFYDSTAANFFSNALDKPVESVRKRLCTRHGGSKNWSPLRVRKSHPETNCTKYEERKKRWIKNSDLNLAAKTLTRNQTWHKQKTEGPTRKVGGKVDPQARFSDDRSSAKRHESKYEGTYPLRLTFVPLRIKR